MTFEQQSLNDDYKRYNQTWLNDFDYARVAIEYYVRHVYAILYSIVNWAYWWFSISSLMFSLS